MSILTVAVDVVVVAVVVAGAQVSMDSAAGVASGVGLLLFGLVTIMTRNLLTSILYDSNLLSSWRILPDAKK